MMMGRTYPPLLPILSCTVLTAHQSLHTRRPQQQKAKPGIPFPLPFSPHPYRLSGLLSGRYHRPRPGNLRSPARMLRSFLRCFQKFRVASRHRGKAVGYRQFSNRWLGNCPAGKAVTTGYCWRIRCGTRMVKRSVVSPDPSGRFRAINASRKSSKMNSPTVSTGCSFTCQKTCEGNSLLLYICSASL